MRLLRWQREKVGRRVYTLVAVAMLVGWALATTLWVRSHWVETNIGRSHRDLKGHLLWEREAYVISRRGRIYFATESLLSPLSEDGATQRSRRYADSGGLRSTKWTLKQVSPPQRGESGGRWGFDYRSFSHNFGTIDAPKPFRQLSLMLPWAFVVAVLSVVPLFWLAGVRRELWRRKRVRAGLCVQCGYDVRATPGRCPECGERGPDAFAASPPPQAGSSAAPARTQS